MERIALQEDIFDLKNKEDPLGRLKQSLLLFDKVAKSGMAPWTELNFGHETNAIFEILEANDALRYCLYSENYARKLIGMMEHEADKTDEILKQQLSGDLSGIESLKKMNAAFKRMDVHSLRISAANVQSEVGETAVVIPNYPSHSSFKADLPQTEPTEKYLSVLIREFPVPGPTVSLQDILEFRNDNEIFNQRQRFLNWLTEINREGLDQTEFADKLNQLLNVYQSSIKRITKTHTIHLTKLLLTVPAKIATAYAAINTMDIVSIGLAGSIVFDLLDLPNYRKDLSELSKHPEVAYIANTQSRFGKI